MKQEAGEVFEAYYQTIRRKAFLNTKVMRRKEAMKTRGSTKVFVELMIVIIAGTVGVIFLAALPFILEKLLLILR